MAEQKSIQLPENYPAPKFAFGQQVYIKDSENDHGMIIGMKCFHRGSWNNVTPDSWEYAVLIPRLGYQDDWMDEDELSLEQWEAEA